MIGSDIVYAPVIIITLNRYEHLKKCIESLQRNALAIKTEVFIGVDYPPSCEYEEGYYKIVNYLNEGITGFRKVNVYKRDINWGVRENWDDLVNRALKKYDRYIGTEDDNVFSSDFLDYMNYYLELYKNDNRVFSICGHALPEEELFFLGKEQHIFARHGCNCYGIGRWKDKWQDLLGTISKEWLEGMVRRTSYKYALKFPRRARYKLVYRAIYSDEWERSDAIITFYLWFTDKYQICPCKTKVKNNGWDGSGVHCLDAAEKNEGMFEGDKGDFVPESGDCLLYAVGKDYYYSISNVKLDLKKEIAYYMMHMLGFERAKRILCFWGLM